MHDHRLGGAARATLRCNTGALLCATLVGTAFALAAINLPEGESRIRPITVDAEVRESITGATEVLKPTVIRNFPLSGPARIHSYSLSVPEVGVYLLELESDDFDALLTIKNNSEEQLAVDEDSGIGTGSRACLKLLAAPETYIVVVHAQHGETGSYRLRVKRLEGPAPPIESPDEDLSYWLSSLDAMPAEPSPEPFRRAWVLERIGDAHNRMNDFLAAEGAYRECATLATMSIDSGETATARLRIRAYQSLGAVQLKMGRLLDAEQSLHTALGYLYRQCPFACFSRMATLDGIWRIQSRLGRYDAAIESATASLEIREDHGGNGDSLVAEGLNNLATLYSITGDDAHALDLLERSAEVYRRTGGAEMHALTLANVATHHLKFGRSSDGLRSILAAESLLSESKNLSARYCAIIAQRHAACLLEAGRTVEALEHANRAVELNKTSSGERSMETADSLKTLADALHAAERLEEAEAAHRRSLDILGALPKLDPYRLYEIRRLLATVLFDRGRVNDAINEENRALQVLSELDASPNEAHMKSLMRLAIWCESEGRFAEAMGHARQVFALAKDCGNEIPGVSAECLSWVSPILIRGGEGAGTVLECLISIARRIMEVHPRYFAEMSHSDRLSHCVTDYRVLSRIVGMAIAKPDSVNTREIYEIVGPWKGQVWRSLIAARSGIVRDADEASESLASRVRSGQAELAELVGRRSSMERREFFEGFESVSDRVHQMESRLYRRSEVLAESKQEVAREITSLLPLNCVVLDFVNYEPLWRGNVDQSVDAASLEPGERVAVIVLRPGQEMPVVRDLGPRAEIDAAILDLVDRLAEEAGAPSRGPVERGARDHALNQARRLVWDGVAGLVGTAGIIVLIPDGVVSLLPFEALRDPEGRFLLEKHLFVYVEDIVALASILNSSKARGRGLLCVGESEREENVSGRIDGKPSDIAEVESEESVTVHASLPWGNRECAAISQIHADLFPTSARIVLLGAEASKDAFAASLSRVATVHIAKHGFRGQSVDDLKAIERGWRWPPRAGIEKYDGFQMALSNFGLMLGGMGEVSDSRGSILTVEEVGWLDCGNVDLVVLASCGTAVGNSVRGEGMLSLRRGFRVSGARSVVASRWAIPDRPTHDLMVGFYRRLWSEDVGVGEALRRAKLEVMRAERVRYAGDGRPGSWAAFLVDGDWR